MSRSLQVGLLGGSVASVVWRGLEELASVHPVFRAPEWHPDCICPSPGLFAEWATLDPRSVFIGLCLGIVLGPAVDLLHLLRTWWIAFVRAQLRALVNRSGPLYRVL